MLEMRQSHQPQEKLGLPEGWLFASDCLWLTPSSKPILPAFRLDQPVTRTMAKKNNGSGNGARDTPIKRAAQEIAAARSKARNTVPNGATIQKRVTRSSGLALGGVPNDQIEEPRDAKGGSSDKERSEAESDNENSGSKRHLGKKAARASLAHRGDQSASSDGDEVPSAAKKEKTRPFKRKKAMRDEAVSSDEENRSDVLSGGGVEKKNDGSSDRVRELERKLKIAEGRCY